ncbi:putative protein kinase [Trypanosoma vivax]|nr:putative protein kinase [Trypanosoma vivax]
MGEAPVMSDGMWEMGIHSTLMHCVYSSWVDLSSRHPLVPTAVGFSLACVALGSYISAGSPRWKGAPVTFGRGNRAIPHKHESVSCALPASYCTSTKSPWATEREGATVSDYTTQSRAVAPENTNAHTGLAADNGPPRHACVDHTEAFEYCGNLLYPPLHYTEDAVQSKKQSPLVLCVMRRYVRSCLFHHVMCQSNLPRTDAAMVFTPVFGFMLCIIRYQRIGFRFPTNASSSKCLRSGRSSPSATPMRARLHHHAKRCGDHVTEPVTKNESAVGETAMKADVDDVSLYNQETKTTKHASPQGDFLSSNSGNGLCCMEERASPSMVRSQCDGFSGVQSVSNTKLCRALTHMVEAATVECDLHSTPISVPQQGAGEWRVSMHAQDASPHSCNCVHSDLSRCDVEGTFVNMTTAEMLLFEEHEGVSQSRGKDSGAAGQHLSTFYASCISVETGGQESCDHKATLKPIALGRPTGLEEKLRTLEARVEQQLRGSGKAQVSDGTPSELESGSTAMAGSSSSPKSVDSHGSSRDCSPGRIALHVSYKFSPCNIIQEWSVETPAPGPSNLLASESVTDPSPTSYHQQRMDRRVDDVFVRPCNKSDSSYALSLTYHDSGGASRTIDTQSLLPPKLPKRVGLSTQSQKPLGNMGIQLSNPLSTGMQSAICPLHEVLKGEKKNSVIAANSAKLVAPLPCTESSSPMWLHKSAGRRGEMRIGAFLGGGWCGKVYECINIETGEVLAAKQLMFDAKDPKLRQRLKQLELELEVLGLAESHCMPWIVGFHGAEKRGHSVLMYLEYCSKGSLLDYMMIRGASLMSSASSDARAPVLSVPSVQFEQAHWKGLVLDDLSKISLPNEEPQAARALQPNPGTFAGVKRACDDSYQPSSQAPSWGPWKSEGNDDGNFSSASEAVPYLVPLPIEEVQRFTKQTVQALCFLHIHGYAHFDVKTANILVTEEKNARLADFGCSMRLKTCGAPRCSCAVARRGRETRIGKSDVTGRNVVYGGTSLPPCDVVTAGAAASTENEESAAAVTYPTVADDEVITELRGTALYIAPEMIRFERQRIGSAGDVWSVGCVTMELATGMAPWRHLAEDKLRVLFQVGSAVEDLPLPPTIVRLAEEARRWLLRYDLQRVPGDADEGDGAATFNSTCGSMSRDSSTGSTKMHHNNPSQLDTQRRMRLFVWLEDFISLCLRIRPEERPSCEELLRHPFLSPS